MSGALSAGPDLSVSAESDQYNELVNFVTVTANVQNAANNNYVSPPLAVLLVLLPVAFTCMQPVLASQACVTSWPCAVCGAGGLLSRV